MPRVRVFRIQTMNAATSLLVFKLERRKLMRVAANMATVARLENPLRLSCFVDQVLLGNKGILGRRNKRKDNLNDRRREEYRNKQS